MKIQYHLKKYLNISMKYMDLTPPIVHIDYSIALTKALAMDNIFDSNP